MMKGFTKIKNEEQLKEFLWFLVDFHDGFITKVKIQFDGFKGKKKTQIYKEYYSLKLKIEGIYFESLERKPDSVVTEKDKQNFDGVELLFEGVEKFFFAPASENYCSYIFEAMLSFVDNKFVFNAFRDEKDLMDLSPCNCFVKAERLSYKIF